MEEKSELVEGALLLLVAFPFIQCPELPYFSCACLSSSRRCICLQYHQSCFLVQQTHEAHQLKKRCCVTVFCFCPTLFSTDFFCFSQRYCYVSTISSNCGPTAVSSCRSVQGSMGAIKWGTRGTRPLTFSDSGDIMCHVLPHFLFRFRNILVSQQPVTPCFTIKLRPYKVVGETG